MYRDSPELLAVSRRFINAIEGKSPHKIKDFLSQNDPLRFIGSADGENWEGDAVREGIDGFFRAVPDRAHFEEIFAEAYESGEAGWACFIHKIGFAPQPDKVFTIRSTFCFVLENGSWKVVHRHGSVPLPNADFTGVEQTAIADLVAAARKGFALGQREGFASIMFTDIVNSSLLAGVMGDRLWSTEVTKHFDALQKIVESADGQFVKSLGDGTMSSFSSPARALSAAREIMAHVNGSDGPNITLRIGIHTGDVVQSKSDFFGTVVNKAARIADLAQAGEICLSQSTQELVSDLRDFRFSDPSQVHLKGFEGKHAIYRLEQNTG
ncbi:MAG: adenylate/guanylate cyclase domain-containing protein [Arenibacterium sp.]